MLFQATEAKASKSLTPRELYTGLVYVTPVMVNPTLAQKAKMLGVDESKLKEVEYLKDKIDRDTNAVIGKTQQLDIWFKYNPNELLGDTEVISKDRYDKITFWVDSIPYTSQTGNKEYISNRGKNHWAKDDNAMKVWMKEDSKVSYKKTITNPDNSTVEVDSFYTNEELFGTSYREALNGERTLANFLNAYLRPDYKNQPDYKCELDESVTTKKGIDELNSLFKEVNTQEKPNKIGVIYGVKSGYQNVVVLSWNNVFTQESRIMGDKDRDKFLEQAKEKGFEFQDGLKYSLYNPETANSSSLNTNLKGQEVRVPKSELDDIFG